MKRFVKISVIGVHSLVLFSNFNDSNRCLDNVMLFSCYISMPFPYLLGMSLYFGGFSSDYYFPVPVFLSIVMTLGFGFVLSALVPYSIYEIKHVRFPKFHAFPGFLIVPPIFVHAEVLEINFVFPFLVSLSYIFLIKYLAYEINTFIENCEAALVLEACNED